MSPWHHPWQSPFDLPSFRFAFTQLEHCQDPKYHLKLERLMSEEEEEEERQSSKIGLGLAFSVRLYFRNNRKRMSLMAKTC